ncbi:hypothetical protein LXL04_040018 [Taraxacum kok-saghyz]
MLSHPSVGRDPESCLRFWRSFVYLRISPLHTKFHSPLSHSSELVSRAFRHFLATFTFNPIHPPTCPLRPVIPKNTCPPRLTAAAGTELAGASSSSLVMIAHSTERALQAALPFFTHAILLDRAFAHCPRFPTAAPRGSPGRVSVPVWLIIRKDQLSIIGLVSLYLTNYLILRRLIKQRFLAFLQDLARTVRQIPTRYAPVRHFVLNSSHPPGRDKLPLARSLFSFCPVSPKTTFNAMGEKADMKAFIEGKADSELSFIPRPNLIGFHFSLANQEADDKRWICWNHEVNVVLVDAFEQCITVDTSFLNSDLCIIFHGFFAGDPNEVANGEVENGSTALRRFFSSKIPRNRDNKREDPPGKKYTTLRYKEGVLALLDEFRNEHRGVEDNRVVADPKELRKLQMSIENLTMHFDEELEFMEQRGLISLANDSGGSTRAMKKGESYYLPKTLFVYVMFDISLLPIKLNLPMVYPPLEWKSAKKANTGSLSDLTGGYLSSPTNSGLLVPRFVAELNVMELSSKLRELYMKDKFMQDNFTYNELLDSKEVNTEVAIAAACFQFQSFKSDKEAFSWCKKKQIELWHEKCVSPNNYDLSDSKSAQILIQEAKQAKHPFQFLSSFIPLYYKDIYLSILSELQSYILKKVEDRTLSSALVQVLNRKIVKSIFMPIIYGKTVMTTALDIRENLSRFLTTKECFVVAKLCFEFWRERFHNMECLIRLIRSIGWLTSSSGRPVRYEVENFQTIQDYMKMDAINIWVYEKLHKKRRQVTLRVASDKRDSRKTEISSFVNFIHQKDAHIAMKVVERMLSYNAPIYTVHDNFISTSYHSKKLASIYSSALKKISDSLIEEVIPRDRLTSYLKENIPEDIRTSNSKRKIWDERIETILNSYESYTQLVCGPYERAEEGRVLHHKKYENFLGMMKKKSELPLYCYSIRTRAYSTYRPILDNRSFDMFFGSIESTRVQDPHKWLITASHSFRDPKPSINHVDILALCIMDLLHQFAYPSIKGYAKFGILLTTLQSYGEEITFSIGTATPLTDDGGNLLPKAWVYSQLYKRLLKASEDYDGNEIVKVTIRVYLEEDKKPKRPSLSEEERQNLLRSVLEEVSNKTEEGLTESNAITARKLRPSRHPTYITSLKKSNTQRRPFMVSDLETLLDKNNYHQPYAAGLLMVIPGKNIKDMPIKTYFSEDYSILYPNDFEKRSEKVLFDLVLRISAQCKIHKSVKTIYFHNFSRFDGIILLKHLACKHTKYTLKPLIRNNRLYELAVYSGKKMLFRFRDSYNLLPSSLSELAKSLCPDLGGKGSVDHKSVKIENIGKNKDALLDYMRQDVYLLGGVMLKAQDIYWNLYKVDIESKITLSSLALNIFRLIYYDDSLFPIHIPTKNEDKFIRHAYYGGHTDVYKPFGEDLYYYDVNSLYPFVMKEYPMPAGHPVWYSRLDNRDLEGKLGFIEAYVVCPKTIKKPFLPYREKEGTLIFPTGEFVGVYYSEELKFAREIGYTVIPLSGYLFEKKESPFSEFVSAIFSSRLEAKKSGNDALSYVYKILMNSLYGRFGINPMGTITEVCDNERRPHLMRKTDLISTYELSDTKCIITYRSNTENDRWDPPKNSAVQLAAAITACARIYMYPYISREDCYYTYTDSVVLSMPLPEEMISSSIIGLFKLEDRIVKGYFLAPKSYYYSNEKGKDTLKYKGIANKEITPEWFISQYADPDRTKQVKVESNFQIEWSTFNIFSKEKKVNVGLNPNPKRLKVYEGGYWVDTKPVEVKDLSRLDFLSKKQVISLMNENLSLKNENLSLQEKLSLMERDKKKGMDERGNEMKEEPTEGTNPTIDEIPNTDKKKVKKANTFKVKKVKKANSDKKKKVKKVKKANTDKKKKKKPPD